MNLTLSDSLLGRQRIRQWTPLLTQQLRLRHVHQIIGFNFPHLPKRCSYYYTFHQTSMSAPFYTSEKADSSNPKWEEIDQRQLDNLSITAIVLRIWRNVPNGADTIVSTWGINLSGLVYLGNKIIEIQSKYFAANTVILNIRGGFFTSQEVVEAGSKEPPFADNLNLIAADDGTKKLYRKTTVQTINSEIRNSYNITKLRRLQSLQVTIKNKQRDVQAIKDKIQAKVDHLDESLPEAKLSSSPSNTIRYAPQLLTMKSVNKMMDEKPTKIQRKEMIKIQKQIESEQFRTKILAHEKDKKAIQVRKCRNRLRECTEKNEEQNSTLMHNYYELNKEIESLKELGSRNVYNSDFLRNTLTNLRQRRRQLLQQLLFIYPIQQVGEKKYTIHGICLPNSDTLAETLDNGVSIALGYITHILLMCSKFLQVPLRYPMIHCGSRSIITDHVSASLPDRERDFPLFTKGKDRIQFTYAVYLLNKNIAQLRFGHFMSTIELQATLPNLVNFLEGKEYHEPMPRLCAIPAVADFKNSESYEIAKAFVENKQKEMKNKTDKKSKSNVSYECGRPGLSEILAIPEAFMNKQISPDSFKNYIALRKSADENGAKIVVKEGRFEKCSKNCDTEAIEQGTDMLDPSLNLNELENQPEKLISIGSGSKTVSQPLEIQRRILFNEEMKLKAGYSSEDFESGESSIGKTREENPLTLRTDALLGRKSFNLVKTKSSL